MSISKSDRAPEKLRPFRSISYLTFIENVLRLLLSHSGVHFKRNRPTISRKGKIETIFLLGSPGESHI